MKTINRCSKCGLPCVASHVHELTKYICGCINNHTWKLDDGLTLEEGDKIIKLKKKLKEFEK